MKKTRLVDIAAAAGVGLATVERVLNERGSVRPQTAEKVVLAAKRLGYKGHIPSLYRGTIRIEVILVRPESPFFSRLNRAFERIAASSDSSITIHRTFLEENDPEKFAAHVANSSIRRHGLIVAAVDHPAIRESLRKARAAGVEVVQIVSYLTGRDDDVKSAEMMTQALHRCPDTIGIYNAGGANLGVGSVLQRFQEQRGRELVWITHELNDETRHFIASGLMTLVFDQAPETQARRALNTILSRWGSLIYL